MEGGDKDAFADAWLRRDVQRKLLKLACRYCHLFREDPEDLMQRAFLNILHSDRTFTAQDNALYIGDSVIRGLVANQKRKKETSSTTPLEQDDDHKEPPTSKPNPEKANIGKEREELKASLFVDAEKTLPEGEVGDRARGLLRCIRQGIDDPEEIAKELGITPAQVRKARELLAETLRAVAKRRGKDAAILRGGDD